MWDEENRLKKTTDSPRTPVVGKDGSIVTTYGYGADGMRAIKKGKYGTVQYVSENYVVRNKDLISKHVFAGNTRLVSNMVMQEEKSGKMVSTEQGCYYYHADHLGSSSVVTDKDGKFYEQIEYFPYGETWVHNKAISDDSAQSTPYKFTGKELDPETGLYYYGARYYDGKLSRWTAADPPLARGDYLPVPAISDEAKDHNSKLPGMGGVFNSINIDAYQYAGQNPVKLVDPDGNLIASASGLLVGGGAGGITALIEGKKFGSREFWSSVASGGISGLVVGLTIDSIDTFGLSGIAATYIVTASGMVGGVAGNIIESKINGQEIKALKVATSALTGALSARIGIKLGSAIANKFEQKLFQQLADKNSPLYKAITSMEGGTEKAITILKSSEFQQVLSTKGAETGLNTLTNLVQNKANSSIEKTGKK